ncbi:MAG: OmpH family outer membrane protein [Phycisphaerales bacterium]|nr:MAG: OmpH family outer membrane protein [Phycisphaerales bacterium]
MQSLNERFNGPIVAVLVAIAALVTYESTATRNMAPLGPAVIACVDLERAFNELAERAQARTDLEDMVAQLDARGQELRDRADMLEEDIQNYAAGSEAHQNAMEAATLAAYEFQGFIEFVKRKIDAEGARMVRNLYGKIKKAVRAMSEENGYDIVFVDDSSVELPIGVSEAEMTRQISARRMLYANPQLDVTDDLITRMNNAFAAGNP